MADTVAMATQIVLPSLLTRLRGKGILTAEEVREIVDNAHHAADGLTNIDERTRETIRSIIDQLSGMP